MIFDIQHSSQKIQAAYAIASEMILSLDLIERIEDLPAFTYTTQSPVMVAMTLRSIQVQVEQKRFQAIPVKHWWHRSRDVVATTFKGDRSIYINDKGISYYGINQYIRNGAHEFGHTPMGYSHGTNFPPGSFRGWMLGDREDKNFSVNHSLERLVLQLAIEKGLTKV